MNVAPNSVSVSKFEQSKPAVPKRNSISTGSTSSRETKDNVSYSGEKAEAKSQRVSQLEAGLSKAFALAGKDNKVEDPQARAVRRALRSEEPVEFTNSRGDSFQLGLERVTEKTGVTSYDLELDGQVIEVTLGKNYDQDKILANLADYYSEVPEHLRESLEQVHFRDGDREGSDGTVPANSGRINFDPGAIRSDGSLSRNLFHHEFGHVLGNYLEDKDDGLLENLSEKFSGERGPARPNRFDDAYRADGEPDIVGNSAGSNRFNEEFADGWQSYLQATLRGADKVEEFAKKYPQLAELYGDILES